jgi:hypothetical protein
MNVDEDSGFNLMQDNTPTHLSSTWQASLYIYLLYLAYRSSLASSLDKKINFRGA